MSNCRVHAANVLHMSQMLLYCPDGLADCGITEHMTEFSMLLAAICHDYDHPGIAQTSASAQTCAYSWQA